MGLLTADENGTPVTEAKETSWTVADASQVALARLKRVARAHAGIPAKRKGSIVSEQQGPCTSLCQSLFGAPADCLLGSLLEYVLVARLAGVGATHEQGWQEGVRRRVEELWRNGLPVCLNIFSPAAAGEMPSLQEQWTFTYECDDRPWEDCVLDSNQSLHSLLHAVQAAVTTLPPCGHVLASFSISSHAPGAVFPSAHSVTTLTFSPATTDLGRLRLVLCQRPPHVTLSRLVPRHWWLQRLLAGPHSTSVEGGMGGMAMDQNGEYVVQVEGTHAALVDEQMQPAKRRPTPFYIAPYEVPECSGPLSVSPCASSSPKCRRLSESVASEGPVCPATRPCHMRHQRPSSKSRPLMGNLEEALFSERMGGCRGGEVDGFTARLVVCGAGRTQPPLMMPFSARYYQLDTHSGSGTPYVAQLDVCRAAQGQRYTGMYRVPHAATLNLTLCNPSGQAVKVFVVRYDLKDMPPNTRTILRQRHTVVPGDGRGFGLRYGVQLQFASNSKGQVYLYGETRVVFSLRADDAKITTDTTWPCMPRYVPLKAPLR